jgi:hypothetical protein
VHNKENQHVGWSSPFRLNCAFSVIGWSGAETETHIFKMAAKFIDKRTSMTTKMQPFCLEAGEFSIFKSWKSYLFSSRDPGKVAIQPPTPVNRNNLAVITTILVIL